MSTTLILFWAKVRKGGKDENFSAYRWLKLRQTLVDLVVNNPEIRHIRLALKYALSNYDSSGMSKRS